MAKVGIFLAVVGILGVAAGFITAFSVADGDRFISAIYGAGVSFLVSIAGIIITALSKKDE